MAATRPLVRQWTLLRALSRSRDGLTVQEIAQELNVSPRTIRRDLEISQRVGFPIGQTTGQFGRKQWHLDGSNEDPGLSFAFDEAVALYLGRHLLEPLAGTVFWEASRRAFRKVRTSLSPAALRYIDVFASLFHQTAVGKSDYSEKAELIDRLVQAIEERRQTFITYRSLQATESVSYPIYPYGIVFHRGSLYLVGHAPDHDAIRHWKIDRVENVTLEELRFQRPEGFDIHAHVAKSFGVFHGDGEVHVTIRFSPEVARYVEESQWHPTQRLTPQKDGCLLAKFDLDGTEEVKRWVLSFGKEAEVVEPEGLREEICREAQSVRRHYSRQHRLGAPDDECDSL